jgi:hypothetical protein
MSGARQIPDALRSLGCRRFESAASTGPRPALVVELDRATALDAQGLPSSTASRWRTV